MWGEENMGRPSRGREPAGEPRLFKSAASAYEKLCPNVSDYLIISAKHGFLKADDIIHENYDVVFGTPHTDQITREALSQQFHEKHLTAYDELVILGGRKYRKVIDPLLLPHQTAIYPLAPYKGIGYMLQALKQAVETKVELPPHI